MKKEEKVFATGYKGFDEDLYCLGKQYKENTVFEEPEAELCKKGIHFCENPLDVLDYYPLLDDGGHLREFAKVLSLSKTKTDGKKSVTTKLKIGEKLFPSGLIRAAVDFLLSLGKDPVFTFSQNCNKLASSRDYSRLSVSAGGSRLATSGDQSKLVSSGGYWNQLASSGNESQLASSVDYNQLAASGDYSKLASSGSGSQLASSGDESQSLSSGDCSKLASSGSGSQLASFGDYNQLASSGNNNWLASFGYRSSLAASGVHSTLVASGHESVISATGRDSKVKGALGCFIACAEWKQDINGSWFPVAFLAGEVDGRKIKEDTFYTVRNGKWVKAE